MEITVSEALRLKNEISKSVQSIQSETHRAPLGLIKEDDQIISDESDGKKFEESVFRLEKALKFSEEINSKIAGFNKANKVDDKVRSMQNNKLLLSIFEHALARTKPTKTTKFENLGNGTRKSIKVEYVPAVTSTEVKSKISHFKTKYRTTQNEIEILNQNTIELSFSHEDLESLMIAE
jgi:hypothetical protein